MVYKVYAFSTPNSVRVPIALEELELPYEIEAVNVRKGEQKQPPYLAINPNGKVPVLLDTEGPVSEPLVLSESGAILVYLAEKTGKLLPRFGVGRAREFAGIDFTHTPHIGRWYELVAARPAVQRALARVTALVPPT